LLFLQVFLRQETEDGNLATRKWTKDRRARPEETEDPDNEDYMPIPRPKASTSGKKSARVFVQDLSAVEDDDCRILDPIDAVPISWCAPYATVNPGAQGVSRKRPGASGSVAPPAKKPKLSAAKRRGPAMPTSKG
jgi:hypothetical protein